MRPKRAPPQRTQPRHPPTKVKTYQGLKLRAADKRNARLNESFQGARAFEGSQVRVA